MVHHKRKVSILHNEHMKEVTFHPIDSFNFNSIKYLVFSLSNPFGKNPMLPHVPERNTSNYPNNMAGGARRDNSFLTKLSTWELHSNFHLMSAAIWDLTIAVVVLPVRFLL